MPARNPTGDPRPARWRAEAGGLAAMLCMALAAVPPPGACLGPSADPQRRGLTTDVVETLIDGIPAGSRYVLTARPIVVRNTGNSPMELRFDATIPDPVEMRAGYEPIPDATWITFEPRRFSVTAGGSATGRLVINIPDDPSLPGRRFEVMLYLHGAPAQSPSLGVGLAPRVLFSVRGRSEGSAVPVVDTSPRYPRMSPLVAGAGRPVLTMECTPFTVENIYPDAEQSYDITSDPAALSRVPMRPGEVAVPDPAWIEINPGTVVLGTMTKADVRVTAHIPLTSDHFGKTYVAGIHTVSTYRGRKTDLYNAVRLVVPPLEPAAVAAGILR